MKHPLSIHTQVRVVVPTRKQCGAFGRLVQLNSSIIKVTKLDDIYMYTIATGELVPQKNVIQVI